MPRDRLEEALALSEELLQNIELGELPMAQVCLKAARLARLLNDPDKMKMASDHSAYVGEAEARVAAYKLRLTAAEDRPVSISSANPTQYVMAPIGNYHERQQIEKNIIHHQQIVEKVRADFYQWSCPGSVDGELLSRSSLPPLRGGYRDSTPGVDRRS